MTVAMLVFGGVLAAGVGNALGADEPTLYERIGQGRLVVHGRCLLSGRRATIEVLSVLKGHYDSPRLTVSYRSDNYNRTAGSAKIEFEPGAESVLILEPELDDRDRVKAADRFVLSGGAAGKVDLPGEGGAAILEAAKRLAKIQALGDQNAIWDAQRALLREPNPHLVRAGFDEILKFRLGDQSVVRAVLDHLTGPRPEFRTLALRVVGQILASAQRKSAEPGSYDLLVHEAIARATGDDRAEVRVEAVRALKQYTRSDLAETFRSLAANDTSQMVRYEAELALVELRGKGQPSAQPTSPHPPTSPH